MRLQVTVDDALGNEILKEAQAQGFSVSTYLRYIILNSKIGKNRAVSSSENNFETTPSEDN